MKYFYLIVQIGFLFCLYYIGNFIQIKLHLMIPGSIIGMFILFCLLNISFFKDKWIRDGSNFLSKHLTLFFIPATVGIIQYSSILNVKGFVSVLIVLFSTLLVMACTAKMSYLLSSRKDQKKDHLVGREINDKF